MKYNLACAALAASAAAVAIPQDFSWDDVEEAEAVGIPTVSIPIVDIPASTVIAYTPSATLAAIQQGAAQNGVNQKRDLVGRDVCPIAASDDTADTFSANNAFSNAAISADTPDGYVQAFSNLQGSPSAMGYMGYSILDAYDVLTCSQRCDAIYGCASFNIYFERDPQVDPTDSCTNPASVTNIKCVYWGAPISTESAVNNGLYSEQFHVVIAGSNGYVNRTIEPAAGYSQPTYLGQAAINAPNDCNGGYTYMGVKIWTDGPFDASKCAAACSGVSDYNRANPPSNGAAPQTCQFFNTYVLLRNGTSVGQYCAMYNETWSASTATNVGQWRGYDHYTVDYSYAFSNTTDPGVPVCASN